MPVMPGRSFAEPTCATQPHDTVGERCLGTSSTRMPFPSTCSSTAGATAFAADAGGAAGADLPAFADFAAAHASCGASATADTTTRPSKDSPTDAACAGARKGRRIMVNSLRVFEA